MPLGARANFNRDFYTQLSSFITRLNIKKVNKVIKMDSLSS